MPERRVGCEQFSVKGGVLPLSIRQLFGEESHEGPGAIQELLQNRTHVGVRCINCKRDLSTTARVNKLRNRGKGILAWQKAEFRAGDQVKDMSGPLRASVRGARTPAAPKRNFL